MNLWFIAGTFGVLWLASRAAKPSVMKAMGSADSARLFAWLGDYNTAFGTPLALSSDPWIPFKCDRGAAPLGAVGVMGAQSQVSQALAAGRFVFVDPVAAHATSPKELPGTIDVVAVLPDALTPFASNRPNMVLFASPSATPY